MRYLITPIVFLCPFAAHAAPSDEDIRAIKELGSFLDACAAPASLFCTDLKKAERAQQILREELEEFVLNWTITASPQQEFYILGVCRQEPKFIIWSYAKEGRIIDHGAKIAPAGSAP